MLEGLDPRLACAPPCGVVPSRRFLTVFLIALLVGLVPAASADPPDPTWIGGFWDDDDFDTVVAFIASTFATFAQSHVDADPCLVWIDSAEPSSPAFRASPLPSTSRPRAPPVASLPPC
jgi:hypothetical protein